MCIRDSPIYDAVHHFDTGRKAIYVCGKRSSAKRVKAVHGSLYETNGRHKVQVIRNSRNVIKKETTANNH